MRFFIVIVLGILLYSAKAYTIGDTTSDQAEDSSDNPTEPVVPVAKSFPKDPPNVYLPPPRETFFDGEFYPLE